ncbi:MAG: PD-(D/E)XK nuclease family protein [Clostridiales bacterium]|nr:PD-(D/E)XK nuclease family protein [Clostridiales bacterium]
MINIYRYAGIDCITPSIINRELDREDSREVIFVVPEFAKAQIERLIIDHLGDECKKRDAYIKTGDLPISVSSSFVGGDILSFITLSSAILDASGYDYSGAGSDVALRCAVYSVLANYSKDFKTFGKLTSRFEYINMLIDLLGDFTRYGIGVAQLEEAIANSAGYSAEYKSKLEDIKLMMESIGKINDQYGMSFLKNRIEAASQVLASVSSEKLKNRRYSGLRKILASRFVFIGFGSGRNLTPQEYMLVNLLSEKGADIAFYVLSTEDKNLSENNIYKVGNEFSSRMKARGADVQDLVIDDTASELSGIMTPFAYEENYDGAPTDKVRLSAISGADNQLGYVFSEIIRLTRDEGYRYRDIRIVCCDDELSGRMRSNAEIFGLDVFIDRRIELWSTLIPVFAETVLELPVHNYRASDVLRAMRCGLVKVPPHMVDAFDNFLRRKNITDATRLFKSSVYLKIEKDEDGKPKDKSRLTFREPYENIKAGESVPEGEFYWKYIVEPKLIPLKNAADKIAEEKLLSRKAFLLRELIGGHKDDIEYLSKEQLDANESEAAAALVRGYDEVMALLTLFTHEMNDVPITQRAFISLVKTDMRNRVEGTIPLKVDSIEITTPERAFVTPCKVMFIVGAARDNFPHKKGSEGLLSTGELRNLSKSVTDCELPDKNEARSKEEFVTCCLTLGTVTDRLYMVHNADKNFTSSVFDYLRSVSDPDSFIEGYIAPVIGTPREKRHSFKTSSIDPEIMERLLKVYVGDGDDDEGEQQNGINLSVTALEEFNQCHLKYMLKRILRVLEREDNTDIDFKGYGTLIHKMYELGLSEIARDDYIENAKKLLADEELFEKNVTDIYEKAIMAEKVPGSINDDGDTETVSREFDIETGVKLRRMFRLTFKGILTDIVKSEFIPSGFEAKIGKPTKDSNGKEIDLRIEDKDLEAETGLKLSFFGFIDRYDLGTGGTGAEGIRVIDYKSGSKTVKRASLFNGTQIQLPLYTKALCTGYGINPLNSDYGYFNVGLKPSSTGAALKFEPSMSKYSPEEVKLSIDYADYIIKRSVRDIKSGKADGYVSPDVSKCSYCPYGGACGNVPSNPVNRIGNQKPSDFYREVLDEVAEKTGEDYLQKDGKVKYQAMNGVYKVMMQRKLDEEKNNGGEDNG